MVVAIEAVETPIDARLLSADAVASVRDEVISPTKIKELENVASAALFAKISTCCLAAIEVETSVFVVAIDCEVSVNAPDTEELTPAREISRSNLLDVTDELTSERVAFTSAVSVCCLAAIEVETSVFVVAIDCEVSVKAPETEELT